MSILSQIIAYSPNKIDTEKKAKGLLLAEVPRSEMDNFNTPDLEQSPDSFLRPGETLEDFDVTFRRPNAQGGMQQLVQPNADGSRPGYSGYEKKGYPKSRPDLKVKITQEMQKKINNFESKTGEKYSKQNASKQHGIRTGKWKGTGQGSFLSDPDFIKKRDSGSQIVKVRNYLSNKLKENKNKPLTFKTIDEIKKVAGVTGNINADITRVLQSDKFLNKVNLANFDKLPDEVIKDIKGTFDDVPKNKWNFDKYKFGLSKVGEGVKIYDRIRRFVQDPVPSRYGFGFGKPEGWMLVQMDRAYRSGNKNYKPIYAMRNGIKKVVGYVDNTEAGGGKKWFHSDDYIKGKNSDGIKIQGDGKIKAHPDYAENVKYHDIVQKAGQKPNKAIIDILKTGGLLDEEGMYTTKTGTKQNLQLRHVMNYLLDNGNYSASRNSIVRHHKGQLNNATSDLQILDRVKNAKVIGIEDRISKNQIKPDDIEKLKRYGVSVRGPDGTLYGSGPKTASGGLKEINKLILKGSTDQELYGKKITGLQDFKKKDFKQLASYLEKLGCGQAAGGRILFAEGVPSLTKCAQKGVTKLENGLKNGFKNADEASLARGILKSGKFLKDAVSLRGLFGPAALAFTAAAEAGIVGYDMLATGKSFKEAIGSSLFNYALGDKTKIDSDEEFMKRLKNIKVGPQGYQRMGDAEIGKMLNFKANLDDMGRGFDLYGELDAITKNKKQIGNNPEDAFSEGAFQLDSDKQEDAVRADIQDYNRTNTPNRVTDYLLSDKAKEGADATAYANLLVKEDQLKNAGTGDFLPKVDQGIARNLKQTQYDIDNLLNPKKLDEFGKYFISRPQSEQSYMMGLGYREGGIASLNVNKK